MKRDARITRPHRKEEQGAGEGHSDANGSILVRSGATGPIGGPGVCLQERGQDQEEHTDHFQGSLGEQVTRDLIVRVKLRVGVRSV